MIPVYYDDDETDPDERWKKADRNNQNNSWYDYENWKWANAVTISNNRTTYMNLSVDTPIHKDDINTMWVWIPRYKYKIPPQQAGQPKEREIDIVFETKDTPKSTGDARNNYRTHPVFTFGTSVNKELAGIWVGKFEMTGAPTGGGAITSLTILPNNASIQNQSISDMFYGIKNIMQNNLDEVYGFSNDMDVHMMKNSEWGAVAYLYHSKYGKWGKCHDDPGCDTEIWVNNSSTSTTGCAGNSIADGSPAVCKHAYDTPNGMQASTTGTIYGVYDMNGGSWEYVMGSYNGTLADSGFAASFFTDPNNNKYYDNYTVGSLDGVCSGQCYGHALAETDNWYSDWNFLVFASYPWMERGGHYGYGTFSGIFYFGYLNGGSAINYGFRAVMMIGTGL